MFGTKVFGVSLFLAAVLFTASLPAAEIDLGDRIGKVLAAEMSSAPLTVYGLEKSPDDVKIAAPCYIVVTVALIEQRSISVVDYKLNLAGQSLACIAVARDNESFVVNPQSMFASGKDRLRLLFIADGAKLANAGTSLNGTLSTSLPGRKSSVSLMVTNLGKEALTPAVQIPADGKF